MVQSCSLLRGGQETSQKVPPLPTWWGGGWLIRCWHYNLYIYIYIHMVYYMYGVMFVFLALRWSKVHQVRVQSLMDVRCPSAASIKPVNADTLAISVGWMEQNPQAVNRKRLPFDWVTRMVKVSSSHRAALTRLAQKMSLTTSLIHEWCFLVWLGLLARLGIASLIFRPCRKSFL